MSFFARIIGAQLCAAVRINFYGNEDSASVEFMPEPINHTTVRFHVVLFLNYYVRMLCDLRSEQLGALKSYMDQAGNNISISTLAGFSGAPRVLGGEMQLQPPRSFGVTRTHLGELYSKKDGTVFLQSKWSPMGIDKYGPISVMYYYQSILGRIPEEDRVALIVYVENIHDYLRLMGDKPNITKINEIVTYALANENI